MILYTGASDYKLDRVHAVYTIECVHGDAFHFQKDLWYALALEKDGARVPFPKSTPVTMKIIDERDPESGAVILASRVSETPWRDGRHYFNAIGWRQVGAYRVLFKSGPVGDLHVPPLAFHATVTDPQWEAELYALLEAEAVQVASEASGSSYAVTPLTGLERSWLLEHGLGLALDPPPHVLLELSASMSRALRLPGVKDVSILAPLFESPAGRSKRLQGERNRKAVLRQHAMMQRSRAMLAGGGGEEHKSVPRRRALLQPVPAGEEVQVVQQQQQPQQRRKHARKGVAPMRLASVGEYEDTFDAIQEWAEVAADEDRKAVERALGRTTSSLHAQRAAAAEERRAASAAVLAQVTRRIYRYDAIPAGVSHLLWCRRLAPRAMVQELAGVSADMLARACATVSKQLGGMLTASSMQASKGVRISADEKKVAAFRYMYGLKPMRALQPASSSTAAAEDASVPAAAAAAPDAAAAEREEDTGMLQVQLPRAILSASDAWIVLLRALGSVDTAAVPSYMHLARFLQAAPVPNAHATLEALFMDLSHGSGGRAAAGARKQHPRAKRLSDGVAAK